MKRTLLLGSAWTASAAAAVGLGFLAVSLVDASASTDVPTLGSSASSTSPPTTPADDPSAPVTTDQQVTDGGTVYASCADGVPVLASAPAAGWRIDDSADPGKVEFQDGSSEIEVRVTCTAGVVQFSVEGATSDDATSSVPATPSTPAAPSGASATAPATTEDSPHPAGDDSDGRTGGGHGSDD